MYRATFDEQNRFKWGKTKSPKSSHFMARLPESIWFSHHEWFESLKIAKLPPLNYHPYLSQLLIHWQHHALLIYTSVEKISPFTLNRLNGYSIGKGNSREINITHLFSSMI